MNKNDLVKRVDFLINQGKDVLKTERFIEYSSDVNSGLHSGFRSASLSFICNLFNEQYPFYKNFDLRVNRNLPSEIENGINILIAIKSEIESGWLFSIKQLISAEIFADFLEMSKHFLDLKYKDAAAVMIGSVLEEHLRYLCKKNSIETEFEKSGDLIPKKANLLNSELTKAEIYGLLEQKNITAWLEIRNNAAHGKYNLYGIEHVNLMYLGVSNFIMSIK